MACLAIGLVRAVGTARSLFNRGSSKPERFLPSAICETGRFNSRKLRQSFIAEPFYLRVFLCRSNHLSDRVGGMSKACCRAVIRQVTQLTTVKGLPENGTAAALIPKPATLKNLKEAARHCRACPLWKKGIQTVFGQGAANARVMFVGEQPGFEEDRAGQPFVGPAGKLLDKALAEAGIDHREVYVTNVVKHFKWEPKGQQHMHQKPNAKEVQACLPWLEAELQAVKPTVLVCLGATAAQALLGRAFRVSRQRGEPVESPLAKHVFATVHPSSILRSPSDEDRHEAMTRFVKDLRKVAAVIRRLK